MEEARDRRVFSRSKDGCARCKRKRLKCDETKPNCMQCQRRHLACPGYQPQIRWSTKYEVYDPLASKRSSRRSRKTVVVPSAPDATVSSESGQERAETVGHLDSTPLPANAPRVIERTEACVSPTQDAQAMPDRASPSASCSEGESPLDLFEQHLQQSMPDDIRRTNPSVSNTTHSTLEVAELSQILLDSDLRFADDGESPQTGQTQNPTSRPDALTSPPGDTIRSTLLNFYFNDLCRLNSAFDSPTNPFRHIIAQWAVDSPLIMNCVMSMSARALLPFQPDMLAQAVQHHTVAVGYLSDILADITGYGISSQADHSRSSARQSIHQVKQAIMASIMLGISSSWLDPCDLGTQHLLGARKLLAEWQALAAVVDDGAAAATESDPWASTVAMHDPEKSLVIGALAYWEALLAFVVDQPLDAVDYLKCFCDQSNLDVIHLHPWTGLSTPIFVYLAQVAILVRQKRLLSKTTIMGWSSDLEGVRGKMATAASEVERLLLEYKLPPSSKTCDTGDPVASLAHLRNFAHSYRLASLLELYRSFPELLSKQVSSPSEVADVHDGTSPSSWRDHSVRQMLSHGAETAPTYILFNMATSVIGLLDQVPEQTGLSLNHTFAMIISGSVLCSLPEQDNRDPDLVELLVSTSMSRSNVEKLRKAVQRRAESNAKASGLASFQRVVQLLELVWSRIDSLPESENLGQGQPLSVHWLDIMTDHRLETVYG